MDSSLSHLQRQQVTTVSLFQLSWVYVQSTLDPVSSVSPLLLPQQHLLLYKSSPHHCLLLLVIPCPDEKTLFLRFLSRLPRGSKSLLRKSACPVPEDPEAPAKRSLRLLLVLFQFTSQLDYAPAVQLLALSSLSCHLVPHLPVGIGRHCGTVFAPLCGASPCSCGIENVCIALYHCVKVTQFFDTSLKITTVHCSCGTPVLRRAHVVLDHCERFPPTGLVST